MRNKVLLILLASLCCSCSNETPAPYRAPFFENPLIPESCADPCIIRSETDDYFYIYCTSFTRDSKSVYAPIFRSSDLVSYEFVGSALENNPSWARVAGNVWAPHVIYRNNLYYYYYTLGCGSSSGDIKSSGIGVATSSTPYGPFEDHGKLFDGYDVSYGHPIDQCVFEYEDKLYLAFGSFASVDVYPNIAGIYYVELNDDGLSIKNSEIKLILNDWSIEGPYIVEMKGKWYLFGSAGTCCRNLSSTYFVKCYQSDSPFGPWKDTTKTYDTNLKMNDAYTGEVVIQGKSSRFEGEDVGLVAGPGHNAIFSDDKDNYYILYHGYDRNEKFSARGVFYDRLVFDSEGFPSVENKVSSYGDIVLGPTIYPKK